MRAPSNKLTQNIQIQPQNNNTSKNLSKLKFLLPFLLKKKRFNHFKKIENIYFNNVVTK